MANRLSLQDELALKIRLERLFRPEVSALFSNMLEDYRASVVKNGSPQNAKIYKERWQSIIDSHYRRVHKQFNGVSVPAGEVLTDEEKALLIAALMRWRNERAQLAAQNITDTNQLQMAASVENGRQAFVDNLGEDEEQRAPTKQELAALATADLKRKFTGRITGIIAAETQSPAEFAKLAGLSASQGADPMAVLAGAAILTGTKIWATVGDSRVRDIHRAANGQKQPINRPFVVNGQFLMHPGDRTRGATADNVVNCRCSARYTLS